MFGFETVSALWNEGPRTTRWQRVLRFAPCRVVVGVLALVPGTVAQSLSSAPARGRPLQIAGALGSIALYMLGFLAYAHWVERRRAREFALRRALPEWLVGFAIGVALICTAVGILVLLGAYHVTAGGHLSALATGLIVFLPAALFEELLFRAVLFKIAEESLGSRVALAIQATVFGLIHLLNPGATWAGAIAIILEAGILLAVGYMLTRRIWFVWGLHTGWNLWQGSFFGIHVSATPMGSSWLESRPLGSELLSGGAFGVEASPVSVLVCLAVAALLWRAVVRRRQVVSWAAQRARHTKGLPPGVLPDVLAGT